MDEVNNDNTVDTTKLLYSLTQLYISTSQGHHQASIRTFKKKVYKIANGGNDNHFYHFYNYI